MPIVQNTENMDIATSILKMAFEKIVSLPFFFIGVITLVLTQLLAKDADTYLQIRGTHMLGKEWKECAGNPEENRGTLTRNQIVKCRA